MATLSALTINTNGLRDTSKRLQFWTWIKSLKVNICFLQETHIITEDIEDWQKEWDGHSLWSAGSNSSRGVGVLFNFDYEYSISDEICDKNGRFIYFTLIIQDFSYKFVNIYAPNNPIERKRFFNKMGRWVKMEEENLVGGAIIVHKTFS